MIVHVHTDAEGVVAIADHVGIDGFHERVRSTGSTLTEAIENLVIRFKQLQDAALNELRDRGFIRVEQKPVLEIEPS